MLDHPLVPGQTSAIEEGPWHYGADYVTVYFKATVPDLANLVPSPFEVDDGLCMAYVCEIVSVSDAGADLAHTSPDRTTYQEAAVGVRCRHGEERGVFFPVMWVTTEWSLLRGLLNGYQKRLADRISMTRLHPLNPGLKAVAHGSRFSGFCVKGPETTLAVSVELAGPGTLSDLPAFGATFGMRRFPKTDSSQSSVEEPVRILKSNSRVSDVWLGTGAMKSTLELGVVQVLSGAVYRGGFTISGSRALSK